MSLEELRRRALEIHDLRALGELGSWDQQTYMPPGGTEARARQLALVARMSHDMFVSDEFGRLLDAAEAEATGDDAVWVARLRRDRDRALRVPSRLVERLTQVTSRAHLAWVQARKEGDFGMFQPLLEEILDLKRQEAEALGPPDGGELYDALLEDYEPGMRVAALDPIVEEVVRISRQTLEQVRERQGDRPTVQGAFPREAQEELCRFVLRRMGFDFESGRLDVSAHPFTTSFDVRDVRLTTRYDEADFRTSLYGAMHEGGHGLYEQGLEQKWVGTPLAEAASLGVHESQSRFWENQVGRSRAFLAFLEPELKRRFPGLSGLDGEDLWRHVNWVEPSPIRVEADEVTYNLHVALRYDLEKRLLRGDLRVSEIPEAWRAGMQEYLGIQPRSAAEGELQDVHWSMGLVAYFPTYLLGNLYAAQLAEALASDLPDLEQRVERGDLRPLLEWLRRKVHRHGRRFDPPELIQEATGAAPTAEPSGRYLTRKYLASS